MKIALLLACCALPAQAATLKPFTTLPEAVVRLSTSGTACRPTGRSARRRRPAGASPSKRRNWAEARVAYGGRGQMTDVQRPRYGQQLHDILLPF